ncbi:hypothetical protein FB451DRAFT_1175233 [Mycena latifolia]|nr:hypothetical protein FB451DRAFT_1175233 [Mycena latifolia]
MIRRWGAAVQCSGRERGPDLHARELAQRRAGRRVCGALHRKPRAHNAPRMRGHLCARGMRCSTCPARRANLCGAEARIAGAYDVCAVARERKDVRACCVVFVGVVGEGDEEEEMGPKRQRVPWAKKICSFMGHAVCDLQVKRSSAMKYALSPCTVPRGPSQHVRLSHLRDHPFCTWAELDIRRGQPSINKERELQRRLLELEERLLAPASSVRGTAHQLLMAEGAKMCFVVLCARLQS